MMQSAGQKRIPRPIGHRVWPVAVFALVSQTVLLLGCNVGPERSTEQASDSARRAVFGKPLSGMPKTSLAEVLAHPERFSDRTVAVEGHVARACTRKGCWMEIADGPGDGAPSCRVTFENYAFFVPKDAPGARAHLEGK